MLSETMAKQLGRVSACVVFSAKGSRLVPLGYPWVLGSFTGTLGDYILGF